MLELRDYQAEWLSKYEGTRFRRVLMVGPTGCGKTVVAARITHNSLRKKARVLLLAHRTFLIEQIIQRLRDDGVPGDAIGAITSKPAARSNPLFEPNPTAPIQVASIPKLCRMDGSEFPDADTVIVDEAHHAPSTTWTKVLSEYHGSKVVGLTATPTRLDGKGLKDWFDIMIQTRPMSQLVAAGAIVVPTVYTVPLVLLPKLFRKKRGREFTIRELRYFGECNHTVVGPALDLRQRHAPNHQTVIYVSSIKSGEKIRDEVAMNRHLKCAVVSTYTTSHEREKMFEDFDRGLLHVLINCEVLTEGWDCPNAKCCIMMRPTMSMRLYYQMVGRIERPNSHPPVLIDAAANWHRFGLPQQDLPWSLEGLALHPQKAWTCPTDECGQVLSSSTQVCPSCGYNRPIEVAPELETEVDSIEKGSRRRQPREIEGELIDASAIEPTLEECSVCREHGCHNLVPVLRKSHRCAFHDWERRTQARQSKLWQARRGNVTE